MSWSPSIPMTPKYLHNKTNVVGRDGHRDHGRSPYNRRSFCHRMRKSSSSIRYSNKMYSNETNRNEGEGYARWSWRDFPVCEKSKIIQINWLCYAYEPCVIQLKLIAYFNILVLNFYRHNQFTGRVRCERDIITSIAFIANLKNISKSNSRKSRCLSISPLLT